MPDGKYSSGGTKSNKKKTRALSSGLSLAEPTPVVDEV